MIRRFDTFIVLLLITVELHAEVLNKAQIDSINYKAVYYLNKDLDSAQLVSNIAYESARQINYTNGIARSLFIRARSVDLKGYHKNWPSVIDF